MKPDKFLNAGSDRFSSVGFIFLNWVEYERIKAMLSVSQLYELSHGKPRKKACFLVINFFIIFKGAVL